MGTNNESGHSPVSIFMYIGLFSIGFYVLTFLYDYIQYEKDRRKGLHRKHNVEQSEDGYVGPSGFSVTY